MIAVGMGHKDEVRVDLCRGFGGQPVSGQVGVHQQGMNAVGQLKAGVSKKGDLHTKASCHVFLGRGKECG